MAVYYFFAAHCAPSFCSTIIAGIPIDGGKTTLMHFTEQEKQLAKSLKEAGLSWNPQEGDWFWAVQDFTHQYYLGESLPPSFSFRQGEAYVFDSAMTWHIQQGGLKLDQLVWLPLWSQCRKILSEQSFTLELQDQPEGIHLKAKNVKQSLSSKGKTDLEAMYALLRDLLV